jgi:hypothetical protein
MEFKLKTSENYLKSIKKLGTVFLSNKTKKLTKIVNRKPKINKKKLRQYELVPLKS